MSEQRQHRRHLMLEAAKIFVDRHSPPMECAVLDVSNGGACIILPPNAYVPSCFEMAIDHIGVMHQCTIAWREGYKIGVEFTAPLMSIGDTAQSGGSAADALPGRAWYSRVRQYLTLQ